MRPTRFAHRFVEYNVSHYPKVWAKFTSWPKMLKRVEYCQLRLLFTKLCFLVLLFAINKNTYEGKARTYSSCSCKASNSFSFDRFIKYFV